MIVCILIKNRWKLIHFGIIAVAFIKKIPPKKLDFTYYFIFNNSVGFLSSSF